MKPVVFDKKLCKGCLLCTTVCPENIISQSCESNANGYFPAEVLDDQLEMCNQCGFCALMCPDAVIGVKKKKKGEKANEAA